MNYEQHVLAAVAEHYGPGDYTLDMTFGGDLGFDSLDFIELIILVEERIDADLRDDEFRIEMTIREFAAEVARQLGSEEMNWPDALEEVARG